MKKSIYLKKLCCIMLSFGILLTFTGCGKKQIFKQKEDPNKIESVNVDQMNADTYYIKDGTKFSPVYDPSGNGLSDYDPQRLFWLTEDKKKIPTYYKGEIIAYASEESNIDVVQIQRYKTNGYSLGFYGAEIDDDGYVAFSARENSIEDSSFGEVLAKAKSDNIRLVSIDDKPVTKKMLNNAGCIKGLEKDKEYHVAFYAGTYYQTATVKADYQFLQYYEAYTIDKAAITKNGYLKLSMPEDAKSGYYYIENAGFFKYYNFKKGEKSTIHVKMNEAYYTSKNEQFAQYSQQYFAIVDDDTRDAVFQVTYDTSAGYDDKDIICTLVAPDDQTVYEMKTNEGTAKVTLDVAIAGKYTINIYPKDLPVTDAAVVSGYTKQDSMCDKKTVKLDKDQPFMNFTANVIGENLGDEDVWGTVTYQDGSSYEMTFNQNQENGPTIDYLMSYAKKGKYTIEIYHYETAAIQNIRVEKDNSHSTTEIINVEE